MFQLINTTTNQICNVENPRFVKINDDGFWIKCAEDDAQCISIAGKRYSIMNKPPVDDAPDVLLVRRVDAGDGIQAALRDNLVNAKSIDDIKRAVIDIYDALFDLYGLD